MAIFIKAAENHALISGEILNFLFFFRFPDIFYCYLGIIPYLYVRSFFSREQELSRKPHIHLLWPIFFLLIELFFLGSDKLRELDLYYMGIFDSSMRYLIMIQAVLCLGYSYATFRILSNYKLKIMNHLSNIQTLVLNQVTFVGTGFSLFFILTILFLLFYPRALHPIEYSFYLNIFLLCCSVVLIAVAALALEPQMSITDIEDFEAETKPLAEKKLNVDEKKIEDYHAKINSAVKKDKIYLNPDLKLSDLSEATRIPSYLLSYAINQIYKKSFNDLINDLRIEEFQHLAGDAENKNITILALSLESGFNSKSNFNTQFKKRMNMTPKDFRDNLKL